MILVDFSALAYQAMYSAVSATNPRLDGDKYRTEDFAPFMVYRVMESLFDISTRFRNCGGIVICLDGDGQRNWRKTYYPMYKSSRPKERRASQINFTEVYEVINDIIHLLETACPYKVVRVPEAEGDDVVMVLAREAAGHGDTMIVSCDKDMIQMQKYPGIQQYSYMSQKYVTYEDKHENSMDDWLLEHVVLGDAADDVPRIVDGLKFSSAFAKYIEEHGLQLTESDVRNTNWEQYGFDEYRDGARMMLDVFERPRFGMAAARKAIKAAGSLDLWLDSDPRLRNNYELNRILVLEEGIPDTVRSSIIANYGKACDTIDNAAIDKFMQKYGISRMMLQLPDEFHRSFTVEDLF